MSGPCHPPRNSIDVITASASALRYTPSCINSSSTPEYSVVHPATISCSAVGRSKGILSTSAIELTKKTINEKAVVV